MGGFDAKLINWLTPHLIRTDSGQSRMNHIAPAVRAGNQEDVIQPNGAAGIKATQAAINAAIMWVPDP